MPQQVQTITSPRIPLAPQAFQQQQPQIQQGFIQSKPNGFIQNGNEYVGAPMRFNQDYRSPIEYDNQHQRQFQRRGRHPIFRRRLHHRYYDDDGDGYRGDDYYHDDQPIYHERLGRGKITIDGPYSENDVPSREGETLVDTNNHGFGPITVEAKTAEGIKKSLGEDKRADIVKPKTKATVERESDKKSDVPVKYRVLKA